MKELPAVNFPTITGSAASSASLGVIAPVFSGRFSVGSSDTVSMKFVNVRAIGVPYLSAAINGADFQQTVCPVLLDRKNRLPGSGPILQLRVTKKSLCARVVPDGGPRLESDVRTGFQRHRT